MLKVSEYRRGRNFVRVGDVVRIKALPGKRNGFEAKIRAITVDERTGEPVEVEVFGGARGQGMIRTFRADRIERVAQTRQGERRGACPMSGGVVDGAAPDARTARTDERRRR